MLFKKRGGAGEAEGMGEMGEMREQEIRRVGKFQLQPLILIPEGLKIILLQENLPYPPRRLGEIQLLFTIGIKIEGP